MSSILFITFLAIVLQSVMLIAFHCLPDALGMSIGELFSGKILWQISMDFGAILIIAFIFALWQNLSNRKNKTRFTIPVRIFALVLGFYFALSVVDYEVLRFNHQRLSYSFLRTYFHFSNITDSTTFLILLGDIKGSILWLCLLSASVVGGILLAIFPPFRAHIAGAKSLLFLGIFGVILSAIPGVLFLAGTRGTIKIPIINASVDMRFTLGKHTLTAPVLHIGVLEIVEHIRDNYKITKSNLEDLDSFLPQEFINNRPDTDNFPAYTNSPIHEYRAKHPYNILLVLGESYKGRIFNQMLFGDTTLAPNLWSLANDTAIIGRGGGMWFKNAFSGGYPTVRGTMSVYLGFPSHPNRDLPSFYASNHFKGFPEYLTDYKKAYITVSNPLFDHTLPFVQKFFGDDWITTAGTEKIEGESDSLGMDEVIKFLKKMPSSTSLSDTSWFLMYNTTATHIPFFGYPDNFADKPQDPMQRYRNALRYTDKQFGRLLAELKIRDDYKNTVIIILGDHDTPVDSVDYAYPQPLGVSAAQIFMGIFSPDSTLFNGLEIREDVASQLDIAPTILDLAQVRLPNHFWGYDLLTDKRPAKQPTLFFSQNAYLLGFRDSILIGGLTNSQVYKGINGTWSLSGDEPSQTYRQNAIGASEVLRALLRNDKMTGDK